eukprot:scaffold51825_cov61-Phaeocystis_antarctica.AAC.2
MLAPRVLYPLVPYLQLASHVEVCAFACRGQAACLRRGRPTGAACPATKMTVLDCSWLISPPPPSPPNRESVR